MDAGPETLLSGQEWRLVGLDVEPGEWNMAVDEALLEYASTGLATLRLYTWSDPCLSIGCLQPISDIDLAACQRAGIPVVRRASGGTAVLHEHTLAYSLAVPRGHRLAVSDIVESYRLLGPPAQFALESLGVAADPVRLEDAHRGRPSGFGSVACFAALSPYELVVESRKLVGNSQLRRRGAILHHAVMPLDFSPERFVEFLKTGSIDEAEALSAFLDARIGSLRGVLGRPVTPAEASKAVMSGFVAAFGVRLVPGTLTEKERELAQRLVLDKYGSQEWTYRR